MVGLELGQGLGFRARVRLLLRTQVDADGHRAQRVRRRDHAARVLHSAQLPPEVRAVVPQDVLHLLHQRAQVHRLALQEPPTSSLACQGMKG